MTDAKVSLPRSLANRIDQAIRDDIADYVSRAEFVRDSVRRRLETVEANQNA
jgi:Arc/MetJ-type ribon-helix-helix transcriptional regulator